MARLFPRTIRLDDSDVHAFPLAAAEGEWAISGSFAFADAQPDEVTGKWQQAFANGFLGTDSFGWSTFVMIATITELEYEQVVTKLAMHFVDQFGAPDVVHALPVAREEAAFAESLCTHPVNTILTLTRDWGPQGIRESFRSIKNTTEGMHTRIWDVTE